MPVPAAIEAAAQNYRYNDNFLVNTVKDLSDEEWHRRPNDTMNDVAWIVGHVIWARKALLSRLGTEWSQPWLSVFARGTKLGDAAGLSQFGVNLLRLPPGAWSSQRHWQTGSDEFVYVLEGEVTLVTNAGPEVLRSGDCAGFKANDPDGHCLQNHAMQEAIVLEIGTRVPGDSAHYAEADLFSPPGGSPTRYTRKDGTPYPNLKRRFRS